MSTWAGDVEVVLDGSALHVSKSPLGTSYAARCHLCGKWKWDDDDKRVLYELASHYDRSHRGWAG